ncbi:MAG: UDP-N-acetylmuramoyl-L-alanyl-D-glutamate--2,6-diaminopimelate ligase [Anaerolineae bacterium]
MKLTALADALADARWSGASEDPEITDLAHRSDQASPGSLFVAVRGTKADGHDFIGHALERGAVALVVEDESAAPSHVPSLVTDDSRLALARMAAAWHGYPSRRLRLIGVTGTDGKTTTATLVRSILESAGHPTGLITSVSAQIGEVTRDTGFHTTTPEALELQGYLAQMIEAGCTYAVVEATSHGLAQYRLAACDFDVAVITNLTHEHLDYHETFAAYRAAKARLFKTLAPSFRKPDVLKVAILNADDPSIEALGRIPADLQLTYGLQRPAQVMGGDVVASSHGLRFNAHTPSGEFEVRLALRGGYNASNALAAISVAVSQSIPPGAIQQGLSSVENVPGRMESVDRGQPFSVFIDFAHTPNALEQALLAARSLVGGGRIWVAFGCAGLRDRAKRPMMGSLAGRLADRIVLTAEDPRTEDLATITDEIAQGVENEGRREKVDYWRIADRAEAIRFVIHAAEPGDLVLITGKGHERSQCIGTVEHPWSDHKAAEEALLRARTVEPEGSQNGGRQRW